MHKLALVLGLLVAGGMLSSTAAFADDDAMKKCEEITDAAEKEKCMQDAQGG